MTDTPPTAADRIRFVLVRTSHPGNIGAAARAIRTMGFRRLVLVSPRAFPHADAKALAAGADDVLESASVFDDLGSAIAGCRYAIGATARRRDVPMPELDPRAAAARVLDLAREGEIALVFGNERNGLDNDEIKLCHAALTIPSVADYSSLNLAQAVQVAAYELRMATLGDDPLPPVAKGDAPATSGDLEALFAHIARTLDAIDFHKGRSPETIMHRLRRLYLRAGLDQREVRLLHGILTDTERAARIASRSED